jgi:hypothetical protein
MILKTSHASAARPKRKKAVKLAEDAAVAHGLLLDPLVKQKARTHFDAESGIIHYDKLHKFPVRYDQDGAWRAFMDTLPRKPHKFLAMMAEIERQRAVRKQIEQKREAGRKRYLRRFKQPDTTNSEYSK